MNATIMNKLEPKSWRTGITETTSPQEFEKYCWMTKEYFQSGLTQKHYVQAILDAKRCGNEELRNYIFKKINPITVGSNKLTLQNELKFSPINKVHSLGVILIFHTPTKEVVLCHLKTNPDLEGFKTKDGTEYPPQLNSATEGYLPPKLSLKEAAVNIVKYRMFLDAPILNEDCKVLEVLSNAIEKNEGWEKCVCVHEGGTSKKCALTVVKHLSCTDEDLIKVGAALQKMMQIKKNEKVEPRRLSEFKFVELAPLIDHSCKTYQEEEIVKAMRAYDEVRHLVLNDLPVATFWFGGAFQEKEFAHFSTQTRFLYDLF